MMDSPEQYRLSEVEQIANAYADAVRNEVRYTPEMRDDRIVMMDHMALTARNPVYALVYLAANALKLGVLIFEKLDHIHTLLWEQELRERNKEGR